MTYLHLPYTAIHFMIIPQEFDKVVAHFSHTAVQKHNSTTGVVLTARVHAKRASLEISIPKYFIDSSLSVPSA